jgi:hypothetical protein
MCREKFRTLMYCGGLQLGSSSSDSGRQPETVTRSAMRSHTRRRTPHMRHTHTHSVTLPAAMHSLVAVAALDSAEGTRPTEEWIARAQRRLKSRTDVTPAALRRGAHCRRRRCGSCCCSRGPHVSVRLA